MENINCFTIWHTVFARSQMIGQQPWRILKEFDCWVTRVWPNGSKAGGQNSGQDRTNPKSNNLIWNDATQLDLKPSQAIWPSHCPQPFSVSPSGPPNDLVHVITTRAVELSVPQMTTTVGWIRRVCYPNSLETKSTTSFRTVFPFPIAYCHKVI